VRTLRNPELKLSKPCTEYVKGHRGELPNTMSIEGQKEGLPTTGFSRAIFWSKREIWGVKVLLIISRVKFSGTKLMITFFSASATLVESFQQGGIKGV